jgi:hypothetical protein
MPRTARQRGDKYAAKLDPEIWAKHVKFQKFANLEAFKLSAVWCEAIDTFVQNMSVEYSLLGVDRRNLRLLVCEIYRKSFKYWPDPPQADLDFLNYKLLAAHLPEALYTEILDFFDDLFEASPFVSSRNLIGAIRSTFEIVALEGQYFTEAFETVSEYSEIELETESFMIVDETVSESSELLLIELDVADSVFEYSSLALEPEYYIAATENVTESVVLVVN